MDKRLVVPLLWLGAIARTQGIPKGKIMVIADIRFPNTDAVSA
jgi:hypothetical protein